LTARGAGLRWGGVEVGCVHKVIGLGHCPVSRTAWYCLALRVFPQFDGLAKCLNLTSSCF
jgi:hypothetical protein